MTAGRSWMLHHRRSARVSLYGAQEELGMEAMSGVLGGDTHTEQGLIKRTQVTVT